jgi:hypothetical protein
MPVSGVSVEGEDALVIAAVVAAGVGDVGEPGAAEGAGNQVADGGIGIRLAPGADLLEVFAERLVPDVVLPVFDSPVVTCVDGEVAGTGQVLGQAGDAVGDLFVRPGAAGGAAVAADAQDLGGVRPGDAIRGVWMLRRSRRPCPLPSSVQVAPAKSASGSASAPATAATREGWLPLMIIRYWALLSSAR